MSVIFLDFPRNSCTPSKKTVPPLSSLLHFSTPSRGVEKSHPSPFGRDINRLDTITINIGKIIAIFESGTRFPPAIVAGKLSIRIVGPVLRVKVGFSRGFACVRARGLIVGGRAGLITRPGTRFFARPYEP